MILECYNLLKQIEKRPHLWTGESNLNCIYNYCSGYYHALIDNGIVTNTDEPSFLNWVAKRLGYYSSSAGWVNMILAYCMGFEPKDISWEVFLITPVTKKQHLESINFFYELIEDFKKEM